MSAWQYFLVCLLRGARLDTVFVAQQPSGCEASLAGMDSRGETPPELAGEDARATIGPGNEKHSVKIRPAA